MSIEKQKLEDIRKQVRESRELKDPHKDTLDDMLRLTSDATNGTSDRIQAIAIGMASIGAAMARDAMYRNEDFRSMIDEALERHRKDCPLAQNGQAGDISFGNVKAKVPKGAFSTTMICLAIIVPSLALAYCVHTIYGG